MKRLSLVFLFFLFLIPLKAEQARLGEDAQISLLTASPSDEEVFTLYGHSALRVKDPQHNIDAVFNYGIFSFDKPYFILRFVAGLTDYMVGVEKFNNYAINYQMRGSQVVEQILNLTSDEKQALWEFLVWNSLPKNRIYRYNFFFDNCATRPRDIIEKYVDGKVEYVATEPDSTFRDLIRYCTRDHAWYTFGCDLVLGSPTDRLATFHEEMFLPAYLKDGIKGAKIVKPGEEPRDLVVSTRIIVEGDQTDYQDTFFTPMLTSLLLLFLTLGITYIEWRKKTYFRVVDMILFSIAGISGCILFFLSFISVHPCVNSNWNLIWLNPLQLIAVILFAVKKFGKAAYYYHFINFAALTLFLVGWKWIPQYLDTAYIPFILTLWVRSGYSVYRFIKNK